MYGKMSLTYIFGNVSHCVYARNNILGCAYYMMSAIKNVKKANKIISANICAASLFALGFMGNIYMKEFKSSVMFF